MDAKIKDQPQFRGRAEASQQIVVLNDRGRSWQGARVAAGHI
jgi:hypothetical protein